MMEQRLLIAYALIALMVAGFAFLWLKLSRDWRHDRRAHRRGILSRRRRREERLQQEQGG
jgi:hypothetical protein